MHVLPTIISCWSFLTLFFRPSSPVLRTWLGCECRWSWYGWLSYGKVSIVLLVRFCLLRPTGLAYWIGALDVYPYRSHRAHKLSQLSMARPSLPWRWAFNPYVVFSMSGSRGWNELLCRDALAPDNKSVDVSRKRFERSLWWCPPAEVRAVLPEQQRPNQDTQSFLKNIGNWTEPGFSFLSRAALISFSTSCEASYRVDANESSQLTIFDGPWWYQRTAIPAFDSTIPGGCKTRETERIQRRPQCFLLHSGVCSVSLADHLRILHHASWEYNPAIEAVTDVMVARLCLPRCGAKKFATWH